MALGLAIQQLREYVRGRQHADPRKHGGFEKTLPMPATIVHPGGEKTNAQQQQQSVLDKRKNEHSFFCTYTDPGLQRTFEKLKRGKIAGAQAQGLRVE